MISVVIPALNAASTLGPCLDALIPALRRALVREAIIVDGGSHDATRDIAEAYGARMLETAPGRGLQLAAGARAARGDWLLFVHADTVLAPGAMTAAARHMAEAPECAAAFTLAFAADRASARYVAAGANIRTRLFSLPYGDQGLLISRALYDDIGGYAPAPLFEDVDLVRRLTRKHGRRALRLLPATATTSAARYDRLGYARCVVINNILLLRYLAGAAPERLAKAYR